MKNRFIFLGISLILLVGIISQVSLSAKTCEVPKPFKRLSPEKAQHYTIQSILDKSTRMTVSSPSAASTKPSNTNNTNKVTLINFWASWCRPCRAELPILEKLKVNQTADIQLVNIGDKEASIQQVFSELNITHLSSRMASDDLLAELSFAGLPATLVWGKDKTVFLGLGKIHNFNSINDWLTCQSTSI